MQPAQVALERAEGGICVVRLTGEHDLSTVPRLRDRLEAALAEKGGLVVDLSAVSFVDSSVLGAILEARRRSKEAGRGFAIAASREEGVRRVLEVTGLTETLPVKESQAEALEAARSGSGPDQHAEGSADR